jgi:hypothetical protein
VRAGVLAGRIAQRQQEGEQKHAVFPWTKQKKRRARARARNGKSRVRGKGCSSRLLSVPVVVMQPFSSLVSVGKGPLHNSNSLSAPCHHHHRPPSCVPSLSAHRRPGAVLPGSSCGRAVLFSGDPPCLSLSLSPPPHPHPHPCPHPHPHPHPHPYPSLCHHHHHHTPCRRRHFWGRKRKQTSATTSACSP